MPTAPTPTEKSTKIPLRLAPMPLARRFLQICTTAMAESLEGEELTPLQYGVLAYVWGEPDVDQIGLAARLGVDRTNASLLVDRLEAKGLIARRVSETDRRVRQLRLTPRGDALHKRLAPLVRRGQDQLLSTLHAAERDAFMQMLIRVIGANEELARPGTGRKKRSSVVA
ncbi:MarR family transcriptional regulator [Bradyrhizobium sp. LHD-71]|uniref:MarR family winged helix-turn-helix transcriptional regulator n=1 Tax=Bradyrhizobium sp. LHD-71 TaxID=3072141 RepID=UPI00280EB9B4|nr:MarR family transcriptional regulator [Bradyrhizobium sp. LHD-71]MDQ8728332.1 MarR family transcriptional regulator [Bradyrhizobium sp. LHD-71]